MGDLKTRLIIDLAGNLAQKTRGLTRQIGTFSRKSSQSLRGLGRAAKFAGRGLDRIGNRYSALVTGAAGAGAVRYLVSLETQITQLGVQSGRSAKEMDALKKSVFDVAQSPDIRVDPGQILAAIDKIVEKTGNLDLAKDNMRNIGLAIRATGAEGQNIGAMLADMNEKFGLENSQEFTNSLDALINQGKSGAFTLQNLATQGERITSAYGSFNRVGPQAIKEMGAMMQMIRRGTAGPEQASTAMEALIRILNDGAKRKMLQKGGIKIMDPDDPKRMRSVIEIVKDIIRATDGDTSKVSKIFDGEAMRAFTGAIIEYNKTGGFASFDSFLNVKSDGSQLFKDSARNAKTAGAALTSLLTAGKRFADTNLTKPIQDLASAINSLDPEKLDSMIKTLGYGAAALGGLVVASKAIRTAAAARSLFSGRKGGAAKALAGVAGKAGATPVMVVNWPAGGSTGYGGGSGGKSGRLAKSSRRGLRGLAGRSGRLLGRFAGGAAIALSALSYGSDLYAASKTGDKKGVGTAIGGFGGTAAGAAAGAAIGTAIVPVIGTAIGSIIGAILGGMGGEKLGGIVAGDAIAANKNSVDIKLKVDAEGNTRVQDLKSSSKDVNVDVDVGMMMTGS